MATFRATFFTVGENARAETGSTMPVPPIDNGTGLAELTTSGTADNVEDGSGEWVAPSDGFVRLHCDGAVWVTAAADPTAAVGTDYYVPANETLEFSISSGSKISVIDDS